MGLYKRGFVQGFIEDSAGFYRYLGHSSDKDLESPTNTLCLLFLMKFRITL